MNKQMLKDSLILFAITLAAGLLLGLVYAVTKNPIVMAQEQKKQNAYQSVFEEAAAFEEQAIDLEEASAILTEAGYEKDVIDEVQIACDNQGNPLGYVIMVTSKEAYGGSLQLVVGIRLDGTVNRIAFLSLDETMGLGMEAKQPAFYEQFSNKQVDQFVYTKSGANADYEIDALSGATITSNAVTNGVNAAICYAHTLGVSNTELGGGQDE